MPRGSEGVIDLDGAPVENIEHPDIQALIARGSELGVPDERFFKLLAHNPTFAKILGDSLFRSHTEGNVDHKLKEIIRIQLALLAGDHYFAGMRSKEALADGLSEEDIKAGCGKFMSDDRFSNSEKWALNYAYFMYREPKKVDAAFYDEGKCYFSEAQIMELGAFIAFHYGMQVFIRTLGWLPDPN